METLACLRASGLSPDNMRRYLPLRERGDETAAEPKALLLAHAEEVAEEIHQLQIRQRYLFSKVAYWAETWNWRNRLRLKKQEIAKELK